MGYLKDMTNFYIASYGTDLYSDFNSSPTTLSTNILSLIITSNSAFTCQAIAPSASAPETISYYQTGLISIDPRPYISVSFSPASFTTGLLLSTDFIDINPNRYRSIYCPSSDPSYTENEEYYFIQVTQAVTIFNAVSYVATTTPISITPYVAARTCGSLAQSIEYSGSIFPGGAALPAWISIDSSTGAISLTDQAPGNPSFFF